jgi:hybrid cluster-associated redox disulfide protein
LTPEGILKKKITEQTKMLDVIQTYPQARKVLSRYGMACRGCLGAKAETVAHSAATHGVEPAVLVRDLNSAIEEN